MTYRDSVIRNINSHLPKDQYLLMGVLGLCGETGEVADLVKKSEFQGRELDRNKLLKELGDVRWYLEVLCYTLNTSLEEIEKMNMDKLKTRYPNGFSVTESIIKKDEK